MGVSPTPMQQGQSGRKSRQSVNSDWLAPSYNDGGAGDEASLGPMGVPGNASGATGNAPCRPPRRGGRPRGRPRRNRL